MDENRHNEALRRETKILLTSAGEKASRKGSRTRNGNGLIQQQQDRNLEDSGAMTNVLRENDVPPRTLHIATDCKRMKMLSDMQVSLCLPNLTQLSTVK